MTMNRYMANTVQVPASVELIAALEFAIGCIDTNAEMAKHVVSSSEMADIQGHSIELTVLLSHLKFLQVRALLAQGKSI